MTAMDVVNVKDKVNELLLQFHDDELRIKGKEAEDFLFDVSDLCTFVLTNTTL